VVVEAGFGAAVESLVDLVAAAATAVVATALESTAEE